MLDRLSKQGIKYLFVSNSDNLGATLDISLLSYFAQSDKAFIMEVSAQSSLQGLKTGACARAGNASVVLHAKTLAYDSCLHGNTATASQKWIGQVGSREPSCE